MPKRRRAPLCLLVVTLLLLLAACGTSEPQTTLQPQSGNAREIFDLLKVFFIAAVVVFVLVEGMLIITILRFRERRREEGLASEMHGNTTLEIAWTIAPALLVAFLATMTFRTQARVHDFPSDSLQIGVVGHQWWWEFQYPPELGIYTANELHIPVNRNIQVNMTATDVIHSFWVPRLSGKTDTLPGKDDTPNKLWFNAEEVGVYEGQCAEFCGEQHAIMRFKVIVQSQADFDAWVASMKTKSPALPAAAGICQACHVFNGTDKTTVGPNLANFGDRKTIAAGALPNTPENLRAWLRDPEAVKSGNYMTTLIKPGTLTDQQINEIADYLLSLKSSK